MAEKKELSPGRVLRFGVFQANLAARELRKHGVRIRLPGQPFCILSILLEKPGEVITREEMRQRLWSSDTFVDFEHGLNSAIKKLRAALGDSAENSRYVETVPRFGYRFIAPVEEVSTNARAAAQPPLVTKDSEAAAKMKELRPRRWPMLLGISAVLIALASSYFTWSRSRVRLRPQSKVVGEIHAPQRGNESIRSNSQPASIKSGEA
ncbi:MAG TPA: winged helix-turn-helix domain-containing protein, partial [Acidobacteriaceae bacterium]|nr:winged helix-turn-helix domain-containing protein [Acidobacteriaceae bacterium]